MDFSLSFNQWLPPPSNYAYLKLKYDVLHSVCIKILEKWYRLFLRSGSKLTFSILLVTLLGQNWLGRGRISIRESDLIIYFYLGIAGLVVEPARVI